MDCQVPTTPRTPKPWGWIMGQQLRLNWYQLVTLDMQVWNFSIRSTPGANWHPLCVSHPRPWRANTEQMARAWYDSMRKSVEYFLDTHRPTTATPQPNHPWHHTCRFDLVTYLNFTSFDPLVLKIKMCTSTDFNFSWKNLKGKRRIRGECSQRASLCLTISYHCIAISLTEYYWYLFYNHLTVQDMCSLFELWRQLVSGAILNRMWYLQGTHQWDCRH